ncbi:GNAT family N-acetyltransferase [Paraburkholderia megapolitana]|nr:GNAT family N-acetyltransferase [Paraburkholderia megapolitana]QDQ84640.1 GNAT family N-acetyltransferase [Paraburkholderia megapolitana]
MNRTVDTTSRQPPEGLTLRALCPADAEQLHVLMGLPASMHGNPLKPFATLASTREYIEKLGESQIAIMATVGDTLVGEAGLMSNKGRRAHSGSISIGVHDAWHRRGIGRALMTELLDLADNWLGLRRVELRVFADNHAAIALYRAFGFEVEARRRGAVLRDGVLIDDYFMARLRDPAPFAAG